MPEIEYRQPPVFTSVADERHYRKVRLAAGLRIFSRAGFDEGVAGHLTVRDPEFPDTFWLNPFGMSFSMVRASDLIRLDHAGNVVEGIYPANGAAFAIHSAVHEARADVIAAAHTHSVHGKSFSSLGIPLEMITQDVCAFYRDQSLYAEFSGAAFDPAEGKKIAQALGDAKACILQNHGLLTGGGSVDSAVWWFMTMERSCQAQLMAMAAGPRKIISNEAAKYTYDIVGSEFAGWFNAQPLFDRILHEQPDLQD